MKKLSLVISLSLVLLSLFSNAQWIKNETLTGGSGIVQFIDFKGGLYIGTWAGIYRSLDNGESWNLVAYGENLVAAGDKLFLIDRHNTYSSVNGTDWVFSYTPDVIVTDLTAQGDSIFAATLNGIYLSVDEGINWQLIGSSDTQVTLKSIAVKGDVILASAANPAKGTIFKSTDRGVTWSTIHHGDYEVDDIQIRGSEIFITIPSGGLYKSADLGNTWERLADYGQMFLSPSGIFATESGAYNVHYSTDDGKTWKEKNTRFPSYSSMSLYVNDKYIFVGLWGGGIVRTTIDETTDWTFVNNGLTLHTINDMLIDGTTLYFATENSFVKISYDEGVSWEQANVPYGLYQQSRALVLHDDVLYSMSGGNGLYVSLDHGQTWTYKQTTLTNHSLNGAVGLDNAVFCETDDAVYKSVDKGDTWTQVFSSSSLTSTFYGYKEDPTLYVGTFYGLFESKDGGVTWNEISQNLPGANISAIERMGNTLFVGTEYDGAFKTSNPSLGWTKISDEHVSDFAIQGNYLLMATLNGKLFISDDSVTTMENIGGPLSELGITRIGVSPNYIFAVQYANGFWRAKISDYLRPSLTMRSTRNDNKFVISRPLFILSDQSLFIENDEPISAANIQDHITLTDGSGNTPDHVLEINEEKKLIKLTITNAIENETYTLSADSLYNESNLMSKQVSQSFTAVANGLPSLDSIYVETLRNETIHFNLSNFSNAFHDSDLDTITEIKFTTLPEHGVLKVGESNVEANQNIQSASLQDLIYVPEVNFSGLDSWTWIASDGMDYSMTGNTITVKIATITGITLPDDRLLTLYPNPTSTNVVLRTQGETISNVAMFNAMGQQVNLSKPQHNATEHTYEIVAELLERGIYLMKIQLTPNKVILKKFIKE